MEIEKTLVLSTGHLRDDEYNLLEYYASKDCLDIPFRIMSHEYGILICILSFQKDDPTDMLEDLQTVKENFPSLYPIFEYMQSNEIRYVDFDQDGPEEKEFEFFNW